MDEKEVPPQAQSENSSKALQTSKLNKPTPSAAKQTCHSADVECFAHFAVPDPALLPRIGKALSDAGVRVIEIGTSDHFAAQEDLDDDSDDLFEEGSDMDVEEDG